MNERKRKIVITSYSIHYTKLYEVTSHGITYPLQTTPFRSNINLNGNVYSLGLFVYL